MKRKVKAWVSVTKEYEILTFADTLQVRSHKYDFHVSHKAIPCTIEYELPKKPKRGKAK